MTGLTHTFSADLEAPPDQVFAALTDPEQLQVWFADHVEIEPRPGGAFRFWGPRAFAAANAGDARQAVRAYDAPRRLAFSWPIDGIDSGVEIALSPGDPNKNPGGARLEGRHSFPTAPPGPRAAELIDDLWRIHCGNLAAHLKGGDGIVQIDFHDSSPQVRASIFIAAPRAAVFQALIDPEILAKWMWATCAEVEPKPGGRYSYGWTYKIGDRDVAGGPTRILAYIENEELVTDWPDWRGDPSVPMQRVAWRLADEGAGTRVTVVHDGFVRPTDVSDFPFGWVGFLESLKGTVEGG